MHQNTVRTHAFAVLIEARVNTHSNVLKYALNALAFLAYLSHLPKTAEEYISMSRKVSLSAPYGLSFPRMKKMTFALLPLGLWAHTWVFCFSTYQSACNTA